jgi:hypothetical protein
MHGKMRAKICLATMLLATLVSGAPQCATFTHKTCVHSEKVEFTSKHCHPQICDFDTDNVGYLSCILTK